MTLRMADGPVANLPTGFDAYAGYVDDGGDGITYPDVVKRYPNALHLSISVHRNPADCADVESGAMRSWKGYRVGYCSAGRARTQVSSTGRPEKLWTAHYGMGAHICGPRTCGTIPWTADGTQWIDHTGKWDESLLRDDFFGPVPAVQQPTKPEEKDMTTFTLLPDGRATVTGASPSNHLLVFTTTAPFDGTPTQEWSVQDVTDRIGTPGGGQPYLVQ